MKSSKLYFLFVIVFTLLLCNFRLQVPDGGRGSTSTTQTSLPQSKPQKQRTIQDLHREWDSSRAAEVNLPLYLKRMGHFLRGRIREIKEAGITRTNAKSKHVHEQFSSPAFHIDSVGRIRMDLYFDELDVATLDTLREWGVTFDHFGNSRGKNSQALVSYFKTRQIPILEAKRTNWLNCNAPFDVVEEVAKLPSLVRIEAVFDFINRSE